jgi:hypothetical protein
MNEFTPGVQNKGGSARFNKIFAAYQTQCIKASRFASAKASASRHLASLGSTGSNGSTAPKYASKAQQEKKVTKKKASTGGRPATTDEKGYFR